VFYRKIYDKMLAWKQQEQGRTALLIEGARRVGKSTIVEAFAQKEYASYLLIDFSAAPKTVIDLFEDVSDLDYLFLHLQLQDSVILRKRQSVIVFDEVQFCPRARQAIKHLVKDGRYDYIETGSLISIHKNVKNILIPSEEKRLPMMPMDFEEFCLATGRQALPVILRQLAHSRKPVDEGTHRKLLRDFRLYMLVGGMPQAVAAYVEQNNFQAVDQVKRTILELYEGDFKKIDSTGRLALLFDAIPAQLQKNVSRYQVSSVLETERAGSILGLLAELQDSKTVTIAYHVNDPNTGLANQIDLTRFKLFLGDTGLFVTLMFKDQEFTENVIYSKLLNDKLQTNLGYLYENCVAQILAAAGKKLYYYTFPKEESNGRYEIDFLLPEGSKICPVEVKSSGYKVHRSLDAFQNKYSGRIGSRYVIYTKNIQKDKDIWCLPIYLLPFMQN